VRGADLRLFFNDLLSVIAILVFKDRILENMKFKKTGSSVTRNLRFFGAISSRGKEWGVDVPPNNRHGPVCSF